MASVKRELETLTLPQLAVSLQAALDELDNERCDWHFNRISDTLDLARKIVREIINRVG